MSRKRSSGRPEDSLTWSLQALLVRHETFIADAEAERSRMCAHITSLETSNYDLETRNSSLVEENTVLQDQVEDVNKAVHEAEGHIAGLTATLQSTQNELDRVAKLSRRTEDLESQLLDCERQQAQLQVTLSWTVEEERIVNQKWRASQRRITELEHELESIEKEAAQERTEHNETIARLERRKVVEDELDQNAITQQSPGHAGNSEVVSSFVKEILQDNANMQLAMGELREMLSFYKETQKTPLDDFVPVQEPRRHVSLGDELGMMSSEQQRQEYHVHHHYHAPQVQKVKAQAVQRPRKKRPMIMSGRSSGRSTPINFPPPDASRPLLRHKTASSTSSSVISNEAPSRQSRWSSQSNQLSDSSSPQSYAPSTIFERAFSDSNTTDYSRPTSPEWSPVLHPHKPTSSSDEKPFSLQPPPSIGTLQSSTSTIVPPRNPHQEHHPTGSLTPHGRHSPQRSPTRSPTRKPLLRRTTSHLSISGMDIHSSNMHPPSSTYEAALSPPKFPLPPSRAHSNTALTSATASSATSRTTGSDVARSLKGRLGTVTEGAEKRYDPLTDTFGNLNGNFKRVGGWLSSRWGGGSSGDLRGRASVDALRAEVSARHTSKATETIHEALEPGIEGDADVDRSIMGTSSVGNENEGEDVTPKPTPRNPSPVRTPGINQSGGLPPLPRAKTGAWMRGRLDEEALRECLGES